MTNHGRNASTNGLSDDEYRRRMYGQKPHDVTQLTKNASDVSCQKVTNVGVTQTTEKLVDKDVLKRAKEMFSEQQFSIENLGPNTYWSWIKVAVRSLASRKAAKVMQKRRYYEKHGYN